MALRVASLGPEDERWGDWRWQLQNALRDAGDLAAFLPLTEAERRGLELGAGVFRIGITPYYASLIDRADPDCPIRRQVVPLAQEAVVLPTEHRDPLGEDLYRPTRALVHKYPDRALLIAVDHCAIYCRHCTRRRITAGGEASFDAAAMDEALAYLREHPGIREVIVSGGDPLLLSDERLDALLGQLRSLPSLEVLRVASRLPAALPMRITEALAALLRRHAPLYLMTHFNHPRECTPEAMAAAERLVDAGVPVENQTVLLRGVNDSAEILRELNLTLLRHRVRPYYLHQGDLAAGTAHLRTTLQEGLAILRELRGRVSGLAIPHYAIDLPGGGGKVVLAPDPIVERGEGTITLRDFRGGAFVYPDPGPDAEGRTR
ncbi:MAG: KamA family radical SAM protein [Deltaproteobacteria bacterium]|nr:KamA family radical SAM protein [Deltaproteobacteria bacterium]